MHALTRRRERSMELNQRQPRDGGLCKSKLEPSCENSVLTLLCCNIRGFISHSAELSVHLELIGMPHFVGLVETLLTDLVGDISLPGYSLVSRRDRQDGRQGGGIALFALASVVAEIVHVADSLKHERSFHLVHTDLGALSIVLWYRPPCYKELSSINDLFPECEEYGKGSMGTIIVGDLNVHHKPWLQF